MLKHAALLGLLVGTLSATSCATIIDGSSENVSFSTRPLGATVYVDGISVGTTPVTVNLSKSDSSDVRFTMEGYRDSHIRVKRTFAGWTIGNLIFGPFALVGLVVDLVTGAVQRISPTSYHVDLEK